MINKYAYATLATTESFLEGAKLLHYYLKRVKSQYPLIIMVTENIKDKIDFNSEYNYKIIPCYKLSGRPTFKRYVDTINKYQAFNLVEFNKVLFLDADYFVVQNIDYVFDEFIYPSNYNFYMPVRADGSICGDICLSYPNPEVFLQIVNNNNAMNSLHDEEALKKVFPNYCQDCEKLHGQNKFKDNLLHVSGYIKYWELLKINQNILDNMKIEEIKDLLFNYIKISHFFKIQGETD